MKITYKIDQYDVDDVVVIITDPEYLAGIITRIHTPHFLLSELQENINKNLAQSICRFYKKHQKYADVLRNESFEFKPDEDERYSSSCWFYTGKFIADTNLDVSAEQRNSIFYENLIRYDSSYLPAFDTCTHLITDPRWIKKRTRIIKIKSLEPHKAIDVSRMHASLGLSANQIYKFVQNQNKYAPSRGNTYGHTIIFPRHIKGKDGRICFPIAEVQKYINLLYKYGYSSEHPCPKHKNAYDKIKGHLLSYSKTHTPRKILEKYGL